MLFDLANIPLAGGLDPLFVVDPRGLLFVRA